MALIVSEIFCVDTISTAIYLFGQEKKNHIDFIQEDASRDL